MTAIMAIHATLISRFKVSINIIDFHFIILMLLTTMQFYAAASWGRFKNAVRIRDITRLGVDQYYIILDDALHHSFHCDFVSAIVLVVKYVLSRRTLK